MLYIKTIQNKDEQEKISKLCDIEYKPDSLAYAAYDDEKLAGISQFSFTEGAGVIFDIAPVDKENPSADALFVLGRTVLSFIDTLGEENAEYRGEKEDETLLKRIGFKKSEDGIFRMNLKGFFASPCQHDGQNAQ